MSDVAAVLDEYKAQGFDGPISVEYEYNWQDNVVDAAACIGCGACVAACPNASAALFTGAKITHLGTLPQGEIEKERRALAMVAQMNIEGFGNCTNIGECTGACPKEIPLEVIANMNRDYVCGTFRRRDELPVPVTPVEA